MAIKGKKKSRGGRTRARAVAPKPKLVVPKRPFFRRTWVRVTLVSLLVLAAAGTTFGIVAARRSAAEREAAQEEVSRVGVQIEAALTPLGQVVPGGGVLILPEAGAAISQIDAGEARPKRIESQVEGWEEDLQAAIDRLEGISTERRDLRRSVERLGEGLELYLAFVRDIPGALETESRRDTREAVAGLQEQLQAAAGTVDSGYLIYLNERVDVGLDEGTPGAQPQIPGTNPFGGQPGGEIPFPVPTG